MTAVSLFFGLFVLAFAGISWLDRRITSRNMRRVRESLERSLDARDQLLTAIIQLREQIGRAPRDRAAANVYWRVSGKSAPAPGHLFADYMRLHERFTTARSEMASVRVPSWRTVNERARLSAARGRRPEARYAAADYASAVA